jgi:hypothetical protein
MSYVVAKFALSRMADKLKLLSYDGEGAVVLRYVKVIYFVYDYYFLQ